MSLCSRLLLGLVFAVHPVVAKTASDDLGAAGDQLGDFDYAVRMKASRTLRRAGTDALLPVLLDAVQNHEDSYLQFRAIVLIYGLEQPRSHTVFEKALDSPNDRVLAAAYEYFEQVPSAPLVPRLLAALEAETSEFVGGPCVTVPPRPLTTVRSSFLGALDGAGRREALDVLFKVGLGADDSVRAPIVIALGTVALRNPELV